MRIPTTTLSRHAGSDARNDARNETGPKHHPNRSVRPTRGERWKVNSSLTVRFAHDMVDDACQLRAIDQASKRTVLKVKNRPGSRRCPSVRVLNLMLNLVTSTDPRLSSMTDRSLTLTEVSNGKFTVSLRGRQGPHWQDVPDDQVGDVGLAPFLINGMDFDAAHHCVQRLMDRVAVLADNGPVNAVDAVTALRHALSCE